MIEQGTTTTTMTITRRVAGDAMPEAPAAPPRGKKHRRYTGDALVLRAATWWLDCRIQGRRYREPLGKRISRSVAKELADVRRAAILRGEAGIGWTQRKDLTVEKAAARFAEWMRSNTRPRTQRTYGQAIARLRAASRGSGSGPSTRS
jgi:hypothetical protein